MTGKDQDPEPCWARKQEIVEAIGQMSVFAGIPAMTRAMELAREAMGENKDSET